MDEQNESATQETALTTDTESLFFGNTDEAVARYSHCTICGANLHFSHVTDFTRNLTQETARCPECGVRMRRVLHKLQ